MKSTTTWASLLVLLLALADSSLEGGNGGGGKPNDTPLEITVVDDGALAIGSDLNGPYVHNTDNVDATIVAAGNFRMDTRTGRNRREVFYQISGSCTPLPGQTVPSFATDVPSFMSTTGCGTVPRDMSTTGDSETMCNLNFRLRVQDKPSVEWLLRFNPDLHPGIGLDKVRVTCLADGSSGSCSQWSVVSTGEHEALLNVEGVETAVCSMPVELEIRVLP